MGASFTMDEWSYRDDPDEHFWTWETAIELYEPPKNGGRSRVVPTEAWTKDFLSRMKRAQRYANHPAIDYYHLLYLFNQVDRCDNEEKARGRFDVLEAMLSGMLNDLADSQFNREREGT